MNSNQLILSANRQFRQTHISAAIADALNNSEKVLILTDRANPSADLCAYVPIIPEGRARIMSDLATQIAPENRPFGAFRQWDVIITTPDYLRVPLTSPQTLLEGSELKNIGLIIVDGLDNSTDQPVADLALEEFCLYPGDGMLRRAIVAIAPVQNGAEVASWLRADVATDTDLDTVETRFAVNAFPSRKRRTYWENFLLRYGLTAEDAPHLQQGLKIRHLAWLDLLLIAASAPGFPATAATTTDTAFVARTLAPLHSTLLQPESRVSLLELGITSATSGKVQQFALVGYLITRGWSERSIAQSLGLSDAQVALAVSALRRKVRQVYLDPRALRGW